jgi:ABC-2 type transport system permease protein
MRNALTIARKELSVYFTTPWAYVVLTAMSVASAYAFIESIEGFKQAQERGQTGNLTDGVVGPMVGFVLFLMLFAAPILAMRLFSEEKRLKTFELLMTTPVRPIEIVIGKFIGGFGTAAAAVGVTLIFPIVLSFFGASESGRALEWSTVGLMYLATLLFAATCIAISMFISSLTQSQMLAAFLSLILLVFWWLLTFAAMRAEEPMRSFLQHLTAQQHILGMFRGALDLESIIFFVSMILISGLLTHRAVEAQRWT